MELPLAMTLYEFSLWIHISAAVVGFGMTFTESILFPVAMGMSPRNLPFVHRIQLVINRFFAGPALLIVLVTGIYQASDAGWDFGAFWISASFAIVIVLGGLVGGYFIPSDRKLEPMVEAEIAAAGDSEVELSEAYLAKARIQGMLGALSGVLVLVAVFLMVVKPGA